MSKTAKDLVLSRRTAPKSSVAEYRPTWIILESTLPNKDFWSSLLIQRHSPKPTPLPDFPNKMKLSHPLMLKKVAQIAQLSVGTGRK